MEKKLDPATAIQVAIDNPNVPKLYMNGFSIGSTNADITVLTQLNGRPAAVVNMSFELAKTLVRKLGSVVGQIEDGTKATFLTTDDFEALSKEQKET